MGVKHVIEHKESAMVLGVPSRAARVVRGVTFQKLRFGIVEVAQGTG